MILVDYNSVAWVSATSVLGTQNTTDSDLIEHSILNKLGTINQKFKKTYGDMIICADSKDGSWRKDYYPAYKQHRKKSREKSKYDISLLFEALDKTLIDLKENFQWPVLQCSKAEADDLIAHIIHKKNDNEPCIIISRDADFHQLHKYTGIKQYDIVSKKLIYKPLTAKEWNEKIARGSDKENIANIQMPIFHKTNGDGTRAKSMTKKFLAEEMNKDVYSSRFEENRKLMDFDYIPEDIMERCNEQWFNISEHKKPPLQKIKIWLARKGFTILARDCKIFVQ